jgi:hypothetical protein
MIHEPMRAQARSLLVGCVLAIVGVAACLIVGFFRPQDAASDARLVPHDGVVTSAPSG